MRTKLLVLGSAVLGASLPRPALAHGGFQQSEDLVFDVSSTGEELPLVVTNWGVLREEGALDWRWTCEEVTGVAAPFVFEQTASGTWLLATIVGLLVSEDRCSWEAITGDAAGLYATDVQRDRVDGDVVWATTASSTDANPLWRSEDAGRTFTAHADLGEGATLRGLVQAEDGLPLWVAGRLDNVPTIWLSQDGSAFEALALPEYSEAMVLVLAADPDDEGRVWLRINASGTDSLVRLDTDGNVEEVFSFEDQLTGFDAGPAEGELLLGGRDLGLYRSVDGGKTWSDRIPSPEVGCLGHQGDWRYVCGHNWADGAAVLRTPLSQADPAGWTWEPAMWFGDVHAPEECPAGTSVAERCDPLWESIAPSAGYDQERQEEDSGDTGGPAVEEKGCGCKGDAADPADSGVAAAGLLLMGALGLRRRRRDRGPKAS